MKIADYRFVAYKIKTKESALRQIDRVWEQNKELLTIRWLEKISIQGRAPLNKTVEGLSKDFKRQVLGQMSATYGGKNMMEDDIDVNTAIERVLRSKTFQSKEQILKTNMLARIEGSLTLKQMQRIDPSITAHDITQNAKYAKKLGNSAPGIISFTEYGDMDEIFDETYDKVFEYTSPSGKRFLIVSATSDSPQRFIQLS